MKKYGMVCILCLFFILFCPWSVRAEEFISTKNGLDVMFVMDYSGSMKTNDSQDIARGMVKAFVDTVHSADIRVGFVAYNDRILTSTSPLTIQTTEERAQLKELIGQEQYAGNTDIGLGLSYGYELLGEPSGRKQVIVLISDGEADLKGSDTGRSTEISRQDMRSVAQKCAKTGTKIYTIVFGDYDGNTEALKEISKNTLAQMYAAETPESLIEVLYGIFGTNMDYSIQEIADSLFAPGIQNIRISLEENYLDEMDVLLISPRKIGDVGILYGDREIETINLGNYAVGKITDIDSSIRELTLQAETLENQKLQIYLFSYRSLTPVLELDTTVCKNEPLSYKLYFRDKSGNTVSDEKLYENFIYEFSINDGEKKDTPERFLNIEPSNGYMQGQAIMEQSGTWFFQAYMEDSMGNSSFKPIPVVVENRKPNGALPADEGFTVLTREQFYLLDEYFTDPDGDQLSYLLKTDPGKYLDIELVNNVLTIHPLKSGTQTILLEVSDGESTYTYEHEIEIMPLWKVYGWVFVLLAGGVIGAVIWKIMHKSKPDLERLTKETKKNHFCGRMNAYFTAQPDAEKEIPPLSFELYKVRENRLALGALLEGYPDAVRAMELNEIHLMADEDRRMILYHTSKSVIMIGNSIACKQIQYSVGFGDVIYIMPQDGSYELEIHYIAMIQ
ncbi:vWA domain-containing protein [Acetivibrio ethanolgignens]|uniref:VWFA domain-containing protein n=1 Tax=Acetivibrio ethanolgignens TaxID=290052 RepID=A0A0V8QDX1_9FIRM|nr:vWA domain-containing protein [Acetivibrio ethanolgignens]KSV58595.1 hypothetical protein ASU35_12075 [Acetivibrio ethanolgignens]